MERTETLWPGGARLLYDTALFPPGTDSFALGYFAAPDRRARVCDLGCGTGLLGALLLSRRPELRLYNVEISPRALALCEQTFAANGWQGEFFCGDLRERSAMPGAGTMDYVLSNPPYFRAGSGAPSPDPARQSARSEQSCTLQEVCAAAGYLLRWGGRFALVHRPERLTDALCALRGAGMEPKRLRFVCPRTEAAPSIVLLEARRGGKSGLTIEPPLLIGSKEWDAVYFRTRPDDGHPA